MNKHRFGTSFDVYHAILGSAWKTARTHKELWVFALGAAILNTGVVFRQVLDIFWYVEPKEELGNAIVQGISNRLPWLLEWAQQIVLLDTWAMILTLIVSVAVVAALVIFSVSFQQLLLQGVHIATVHKHRISFRRLWHGMVHIHFWRLFAVNAMIILTLLFLIIGSSFPLSIALQYAPEASSWIYAACYTLLIPISLIVNMVGMVMMVEIVRADLSIDAAFLKTLKKLKHHWLFMTEFGFLLFLLNTLLAFLGILILLLFLVPIGVVEAFAIGSGWPGGADILSTLAFMVVLIAGMGYAAFITTFNYSAWTECTSRLEHFSWHPCLEHFTRRIMALFSRT
ncbi:MAG: hypothetical protein WC730_02155 [Patescibacteria group bacterium]|jgi:hypothetical protein